MDQQKRRRRRSRRKGAKIGFWGLLLSGGTLEKIFHSKRKKSSSLSICFAFSGSTLSQLLNVSEIQWRAIVCSMIFGSGFMALRKSKSCSSITISNSVHFIGRSSFDGKKLCTTHVNGENEEEKDERRFTGERRNWENIGYVIWSIHFYHFIHRKRLFLSLAHHDDVMYIYNELFLTRSFVCFCFFLCCSRC